MARPEVTETSFGAPSADGKPSQGKLKPDLKRSLEKPVQRHTTIIELEPMPDHVLLLVSADPQHDIRRLVKRTKGRSSRLLWHEILSVKQYVENQQKG